jgi:signal transduction histidine kinase
MIAPTKKRLARIFTTVILVFNALIISISFVFLHHSIMAEAKRHMREDIKNEFIDQYSRSGLDPIKAMWDEHYFQILNKEGNVVVSTKNSVGFYPRLNIARLGDAFRGKEVFGIEEIGSEMYLISYFPLDETYVGRAALSLKEVGKYERNFFNLILITLPGMLLLSYFVSRYLVNSAMERISDFFTFQETFSSNVTHELRSPLASVKGNLEVTLRKERSIEEYKGVLSLSLREVDRIIGLLNNLYLLASSKFKPIDLFKNDANLVRIIHDVVRNYGPIVASRGIALTVTEAAPVIVCRCDEALIRRTIENVIDNAVKYTPEEGSITLSVARDREAASVTVANTCRPLDKDEIAHIFDPFYRGKSTKEMNVEGKGLGLYISRYIIKSHRGEIKINNTQGNIFSLTITLPVR